MSNCKNVEGGTHHYACECREQYLRELQAENKRLRCELKEISEFGDGVAENWIDYKNCFRNMKYRAKQAITPKEDGK